MSQIFHIILYGLISLYISGAVPYGSYEPDLLSPNETSPDYKIRLEKAAEIVKYMNKSVDPCDDFYEYSCGNWAKFNKANITKLITGFVNDLNDGFNKELVVLLDRVNEKEDPPTDTLVKNYYKSCMMMKEIDKPIQEKYKSIVEEFGGMPVLQGDNWLEADFDWVTTASKIAFNYGLIILAGSNVDEDYVHGDVNVVYFNKQDFYLKTRTMYLGNNTEIYRRNYKNGVAKILTDFLGVEKELSKKTAIELIDFETELAEGLDSETEKKNTQRIYNSTTTISELQRLYAPDIDVERLVNGSLGKHIESIINPFPRYQENLIKVLRRTSKRVVANYISFRLLLDMIHIPSKNEAEREDMCILKARTHFGKILDNIFFRNHNGITTSNEIRNIFSELKTIFREKLQRDNSLNWIQNDTRISAIKKLDAMTLQIKPFNLEEIIEEFKGLHMSSDDFLLNQRRIEGHEAFQNRDKFNKPIKPSYTMEESTSPANVIQENYVSIPIAMLQPKFSWGASYPSAIKFATLAFLIGHEMIHAFDTAGREFDANGNIKNWWDDQSSSNFLERQNCFKRQYSKYSYNGMQMPESDRQAENIADNGGLQLAFAAYQHWLQEHLEASNDIIHLETERLPSLDYSNKQLFFISYAQLWCNDVTPEYRNMMVNTDSHMPGQLRVIGPLSNFDEFAKEFKCQQGTPMNPIRKCQIY